MPAARTSSRSCPAETAVGEMGLGDVDLYLIGEGRHERLWEKLGAHVVDDGVRFAVWAPNAREVSVVGDWNFWSVGADPLDVPGLVGRLGRHRRWGDRRGSDTSSRSAPGRAQPSLRADPVAFRAEPPPDTASTIFTLAPRLERRRLARSTREHRPRRRAALDLRGARGVVAAGARLERAGAAARRLPRGDGRSPTWSFSR